MIGKRSDSNSAHGTQQWRVVILGKAIKEHFTVYYNHDRSKGRLYLFAAPWFGLAMHWQQNSVAPRVVRY